MNRKAPGARKEEKTAALANEWDLKQLARRLSRLCRSALSRSKASW
jgi:hypothetical protein